VPAGITDAATLAEMHDRAFAGSTGPAEAEQEAELRTLPGVPGQ